MSIISITIGLWRRTTHWHNHLYIPTAHCSKPGSQGLGPFLSVFSGRERCWIKEYSWWSEKFIMKKLFPFPTTCLCEMRFSSDTCNICTQFFSKCNQISQHIECRNIWEFGFFSVKDIRKNIKQCHFPHFFCFGKYNFHRNIIFISKCNIIMTI